MKEHIQKAEELETQHVIECYNVPDIDMNKHDGGLPHMAGVYTYQVRRSCRADGDYTYNHAPMLTGFNNRLLLSYISGKKDEHGAPDEVVYTTSKDGITWEKERTMFPYMLADTKAYIGPDKELLPEHAKMIVHSRMCFYQASNGRMLATTFYGFSPDFHRAPNNGFGAARLVREVYKDFTLSDIFVIKYNTAGGFTKDTTHFYEPEDDSPVNIPYYDEAADESFVSACSELLSKKLILEQWYEEEMYDKEHYVHGRALSFYTAKDGSIVGLCKKGEGYIFDKEGNIVLDEKIPTLITNTAKVWGQKTPDDDYIICYNPTTDSSHRWPLAAMKSEDGRAFYNMKAIIPELPPYRYEGHIKNLGAQYMRGICDYNDAFDKNVWITYSCNKEDIWISKIVSATAGDADKKYSVMSPLWGSIKRTGTSLWEIVDNDACERAIIEYFPDKCENVSVKINVKNISDDNGVKVVFYDVSGNVIKEAVCKQGECVVECGIDEAGRDINGACMIKKEVNGVDMINSRCEATTPARIAVYSKERLALNTLSDDGRLGALSDIKDADRKDYCTEFSVEFVSKE